MWKVHFVCESAHALLADAHCGGLKKGAQLIQRVLYKRDGSVLSPFPFPSDLLTLVNVLFCPPSLHINGAISLFVWILRQMNSVNGLSITTSFGTGLSLSVQHTS